MRFFGDFRPKRLHLGHFRGRRVKNLPFNLKPLWPREPPEILAKASHFSWKPTWGWHKWGYQNFKFFVFFQWYKLKLKDADTDTDTEHYKWPSLGLHGPADAFGTLLIRWLTCNADLKKLTGHHLLKVKVCQPRIPAIFARPRILQQGEWHCTITPVHPGGIVDVFRGGNQISNQPERTWLREVETQCWLVARKFSSNLRFQKFRGTPSETAEIRACFENSWNFETKISKMFRFRNFCFQNFKHFGFSSFYVFFLSWMALPQSGIPLRLVEAAEPLLLLPNSGEDKRCRNSGLADLDLERMMPG